jgi:PAS domain-containing protein
MEFAYLIFSLVVWSMPAYEIETILSRHLADCLSIPIFLTDTKGNLLFYNEPAEEILGKRFEDTGPMEVEEWSSVFKPETDTGMPIASEDLPLVKTLITRTPSQGKFWIQSLDGERHHLSVTAVPLIGHNNRYLGAMAIFWKNVLL